MYVFQTLFCAKIIFSSIHELFEVSSYMYAYVKYTGEEAFLEQNPYSRRPNCSSDLPVSLDMHLSWRSVAVW